MIAGQALVIAFASLFLGLVLGIQTVEVVVSDDVVAVDLFLNGEKVAEIDGPPWAAECDLGGELAPHELVAVARGARGEEIARAEQWINLPRETAEATLILEEGSGGRGRTARLTWDSLAGAQTPRVRMVFDGEVLEVEDPARFVLPDHDPRAVHFLRAELDFGEVAGASAELVFGGHFGDRVASQLTAVPVAGRLPPAEKLDGWFRVGDREPRVVAADKGVADILVVRDRGATETLRRLKASGRSRRPWGHWRVRLHSSHARRAPGGAHVYDLFPVSPFYENSIGPLPHLVAVIPEPGVEIGAQRLADSVTVAGVSAAAGRGRRAVILVLGDEPEDASRIQPGNARGFLERLRVPLYVWSTVDPPSETARSWGSAVDVSSIRKLQAAAAQVERGLQRQRVVWLEGRHLPDRIALTERATGLTLVR